jgi:hypothetical protein
MEEEDEKVLEWGGQAVVFRCDYGMSWTAEIGGSRIVLTRDTGGLPWKVSCSLSGIRCAGISPQHALDCLFRMMKRKIERLQTVVRGA